MNRQMLAMMKFMMEKIKSAPRDGTTIIGIYGDEEALIFWSERPVCMLGASTGGFPAGWATAIGGETDFNLPVDEPDYWKPKMNRTKDCYCHTCDKWFHHLGIASHRASHRQRLQDCEITYANGETFTHDFSNIVRPQMNSVLG